MRLCGGNRVSPHFAITWLAAVVGSAIVILIFSGISLLQNAVTPASVVEVFLSQPTNVKFFVGFLTPICWCIMLGFVSHNNQITLCEALSRGVRVTLYLIAALYIVITVLT